VSSDQGTVEGAPWWVVASRRFAVREFPSDEHALTAALSDQGGYTQIHLRLILDRSVIWHTVKRPDQRRYLQWFGGRSHDNIHEVS
jgi:hypothetical protein